MPASVGTGRVPHSEPDEEREAHDIHAAGLSDSVSLLPMGRPPCSAVRRAEVPAERHEPQNHRTGEPPPHDPEPDLHLPYCCDIAMRRRSSGSMKWSWSSSPRSICTQLILPVNRLSLAV